MRKHLESRSKLRLNSRRKYVLPAALGVVCMPLILHQPFTFSNVPISSILLLVLFPAVIFLSWETRKQRFTLEAVEKELDVLERRYREIFDSISEAIILLERKTLRVVKLNRSACHLLNCRPDETDRVSVQCLLGAELLKTQLSPGESRRHEDIAVWLRGVELRLEAELTRCCAPGADWLLLLLRDRTEQKQAEREQRRLEEQFLHSQKMESIGRLAGGVAHDFNNILTVIGGRAELGVNLASADGRLTREFNEIKKAAAKAARLTEQLLAFSRKQLLKTDVVDLSLVVSEIEDMLKRLIGEDIQLQTWLKEGLRIRADLGQLEQVIVNLVVNARDAMPAGGRLSIRTDQRWVSAKLAVKVSGLTEGLYALLEIVDTGTGMDEMTRARVFEPFFTTKELGKGTGLGLSTVYGIVHQHKGAVLLDTSPGKGSRFSIYLPLLESRDDFEGQLDVQKAFARGEPSFEPSSSNRAVSCALTPSDSPSPKSDQAH